MESWKHALGPNYTGKQSLAALEGMGDGGGGKGGVKKSKGEKVWEGHGERKDLKRITVRQFGPNQNLIIPAEAKWSCYAQ